MVVFAGMWALVPDLTLVDVDSCAEVLKEIKGTDTQSLELVSPDIDLESDDSISEFERNLRELMPDLHRGIGSTSNA